MSRAPQIELTDVLVLTSTLFRIDVETIKIGLSNKSMFSRTVRDAARAAVMLARRHTKLSPLTLGHVFHIPGNAAARINAFEESLGVWSVERPEAVSKFLHLDGMLVTAKERRGVAFGDVGRA